VADKHEGVASLCSELGGTQLQQLECTMVRKASSIPHMIGDVYNSTNLAKNERTQ
jgi:hypothetical protein